MLAVFKDVSVFEQVCYKDFKSQLQKVQKTTTKISTLFDIISHEERIQQIKHK